MGFFQIQSLYQRFSSTNIVKILTYLFRTNSPIDMGGSVVEEGVADAVGGAGVEVESLLELVERLNLKQVHTVMRASHIVDFTFARKHNGKLKILCFVKSTHLKWVSKWHFLSFKMCNNPPPPPHLLLLRWFGGCV